MLPVVARLGGSGELSWYTGRDSRGSGEKSSLLAGLATAGLAGLSNTDWDCVLASHSV